MSTSSWRSDSVWPCSARASSLRQRPYELAEIFGVALVAFGLFRYQLRHLKVGAAGLE